jgi:acyl-CoA synthetase (AMP-forming)/AMP-acid ligase II
MAGDPALEREWRDATSSGTDLVRRPPGLTVLPLSSPQDRWWCAISGDPGHPSFNLFQIHRLRGPLDADALVRALGALVDRHESLRATFPVRDGRPVQVIAPPSGLFVERVSADPAAARELVAGWTSRRFDLATGPLIRAYLLSLGPDDHVLCVVVHHMVADGHSLDLLVRELRTLYAGGEPPGLAIGYGDYALWQWARPGTVERNLAYWLRRLTDPPVLDLPTDLPRPATKTGSGYHLEHTIDADLAQRLEHLARAERCTLFIVLTAAYQALLARHSGQDDICVLSSSAGRTHVELEPLVGNFASFPVLRGDLSGNPTFRELLVRTRTAVLEGYAHGERPLRRLLDALDLPADGSRVPLYQTSFTLHHQDADATGEFAPGLRAEPFETSYPQTFFDLALDMWRRPTGFTAVFRYDGALFTAETVAAYARRFECLLRDAADRPEARLSELTLDNTSDETIRDAWGAPAPRGIWGELHVDGQPTGERARRLPDGRLQKAGRLDDMVRRRRCRVWPAEVAERLREHPAVTDATVTAGPDGLIAHVIASVPDEVLRKDFESSLPAPLLPDEIVVARNSRKVPTLPTVRPSR